MKFVCRVMITLSLLLVGCSLDVKKKETELPEMQAISGRDEGDGRHSIYQMKVPQGWIRHDSLPGEALVDTKKALCEFIILEDSKIIRINIHNFPSNELSERIPSSAQVARWRGQFEILNAASASTIPQSFSGYSGLLFRGDGTLQGKAATMMAWSLQLAQEHYRMLMRADSKEEESLTHQMRADVTIKAVGPTALMEKHKGAIYKAARSFELIREIPSRR